MCRLLPDLAQERKRLANVARRTETRNEGNRRQSTGQDAYSPHPAPDAPPVHVERNRESNGRSRQPDALCGRSSLRNEYGRADRSRQRQKLVSAKDERHRPLERDSDPRESATGTGSV